VTSKAIKGVQKLAENITYSKQEAKTAVPCKNPKQFSEQLKNLARQLNKKNKKND